MTIEEIRYEEAICAEMEAFVCNNYEVWVWPTEEERKQHRDIQPEYFTGHDEEFIPRLCELRLRGIRFEVFLKSTTMKEPQGEEPTRTYRGGHDTWEE